MTHKNRAKALVAQMSLPEKVAQMRYNAPAIERLGVPAYNWWNECLHGVARAGAATVFPQAIALAAEAQVVLDVPAHRVEKRTARVVAEGVPQDGQFAVLIAGRSLSDVAMGAPVAVAGLQGHLQQAEGGAHRSAGGVHSLQAIHLRMEALALVAETLEFLRAVEGEVLSDGHHSTSATESPNGLRK